MAPHCDAHTNCMPTTITQECYQFASHSSPHFHQMTENKYHQCGLKEGENVTSHPQRGTKRMVMMKTDELKTQSEKKNESLQTLATELPVSSYYNVFNLSNQWIHLKHINQSASVSISTLINNGKLPTKYNTLSDTFISEDGTTMIWPTEANYCLLQISQR